MWYLTMAEVEFTCTVQQNLANPEGNIQPNENFLFRGNFYPLLVLWYASPEPELYVFINNENEER